MPLRKSCCVQAKNMKVLLALLFTQFSTGQMRDAFDISYVTGTGGPQGVSTRDLRTDKMYSPVYIPLV